MKNEIASDPLTPPECDLRGLPFMPLDVVRLLDSDLFALSTGEEFKAAVSLWCKSWLQVPAASLPDDDRILAALAGLGRDIKAWFKIKDMAMRGFTLCNDGRWYHEVIALKALEAWRHRLKQREKSAKGNEKRWKKPTPSDGHCDPHGDASSDPHWDPTRDRKGQGEGELSKEIPLLSSHLGTPRAARSDDEKPQTPAEWIEVFSEQHGVDVDHRSFHDRKKFWPLAAAWTNAGVTVGQMRAACSRAFSTASEPIAWLPAYADRVLAGMQAPPQTKAERKSLAQQDREAGWARWEQMTGRTHPDRIASNPITIEVERTNVVAIEGH